MAPPAQYGPVQSHQAEQQLQRQLHPVRIVDFASLSWSFQGHPVGELSQAEHEASLLALACKRQVSVLLQVHCTSHAYNDPPLWRPTNTQSSTAGKPVSRWASFLSSLYHVICIHSPKTQVCPSQYVCFLTNTGRNKPNTLHCIYYHTTNNRSSGVVCRLHSSKHPTKRMRLDISRRLHEIGLAVRNSPDADAIRRSSGTPCPCRAAS